jgi:site-specific DNA-methyltransferase (adenine-specific)
MSAVNTLYYGDNLEILRKYIADNSIDLVYLDPPFNSNRNYNVLFKDESGQDSEAQIEVFEDTWHWNIKAERTYEELVTRSSAEISALIGALRSFIGTNQMMAYLVMMATRLVELHRVLKPTGSLYLHCDPTSSHYLKVVLDTIFGVRSFRNEIVWRRYGTHNDVGQGSRHFGRVHDVILFYTKDKVPSWNQIYTPLSQENLQDNYRSVEEGTGRRYTTSPMTGPGGVAKGNPVFEWHGHTRAWRYSRETIAELDRQGRLHYSKTGYARQKMYLDESKGVPVQDLWDDIQALVGESAERLGYPTQKPIALLERIIASSTNPGDTVLDPFCGCGTAIDAAQKLGRSWVGIDITSLAIALQKVRLQRYTDLSFQVVGLPKDLHDATQLAHDDRYQFQWWALSLIDARPLGGTVSGGAGKKGSDKGIDGVIVFLDDPSAKPKRVLVQVKSGGVSTRDIRDLVGTVEREKAAMGVFITLEPVKSTMRTEAISHGFYDSPWGGKHPKIQGLSIEGLLNGSERLDMPPLQQVNKTFKQAPKVQQVVNVTASLFDAERSAADEEDPSPSLFGPEVGEEIDT